MTDLSAPRFLAENVQNPVGQLTCDNQKDPVATLVTDRYPRLSDNIEICPRMASDDIWKVCELGE